MKIEKIHPKLARNSKKKLIWINFSKCFPWMPQKFTSNGSQDKISKVQRRDQRKKIEFFPKIAEKSPNSPKNLFKQFYGKISTFRQKSPKGDFSQNFTRKLFRKPKTSLWTTFEKNSIFRQKSPRGKNRKF